MRRRFQLLVRRCHNVSPDRGRQAGTPNRRTVTIQQKLEALGCEPFEAMAKLAMDETTPVAIRASLLRDLATYVAPRRAAAHICAPTLLPPPRADLEAAAFRGDLRAFDLI